MAAAVCSSWATPPFPNGPPCWWSDSQDGPLATIFPGLIQVWHGSLRALAAAPRAVSQERRAPSQWRTARLRTGRGSQRLRGVLDLLYGALPQRSAARPHDNDNDNDSRRFKVASLACNCDYGHALKWVLEGLAIWATWSLHGLSGRSAHWLRPCAPLGP